MPDSVKITSDDWGMSPGVNDGILALARLGMIKRVSILANSKYVEHRLEELKKIPGLQLGLHYDLTHKTSGGYLSPAHYLLSWFTIVGSWRRYRVLEAQQMLTVQFDRLEQLGIQAVHIDGHHHMHLAPRLLPHLLPEITKRGIKEIRCTYDRRLWLSKKFILNMLSLAAIYHLKQLKVSRFLIPDFVYLFWKDFLNAGNLRARLIKNPSFEFMTHPALVDDLETVGDPDIYTWQRVYEFQVLKTMSYLLKSTAKTR